MNEKGVKKLSNEKLIFFALYKLMMKTTQGRRTVEDEIFCDELSRRAGFDCIVESIRRKHEPTV